MVRPLRPRLLLAAIAAGVVAVAVVGVGAVRQLETQAGGIPATDLALVELTAAESIAPYAIRQPTWLPEGYALDRVLYSNEGAVVSVDLYYRAGEEVVHVWQTNIPADDFALADKDPLTTRNPVPVELGGATWAQKELEGPSGTVWYVATRLDDGVTIAVDGAIELETVHEIAASILVAP